MIDFPEMPARQRSVYEVLEPNLGIYLGVAGHQVPDNGFADAQNVRIKNKKVTNEFVGYELHHALGLGNQVLLIDDFIQTNGAAITIYGTKEDLFQYDTGSDEPKYITPIYATGTVTVTNGSAVVAGSGTTWLTNLKVGDKFHSGSATQVDVDAVWYTILSVDSDVQITLTANYGEATLGGQAYTGRKLFTASDADTWDTDVFPDAPLGTTSALPAGDHWFATNGSELVVWDGLAARVVVVSTESTGLGFSCKTVAYYKNMMLYGNLVESGTAKPANAKNTAIADPENVTTLEANEFTMLEGVDFILATIPLGDFIVIYGDNSVAIAQFVSVPVFFAIRTVAPGIGIYSSRMVMDFGDFHEFLSTDQAYRFDGVRLQPFGDQVFKDVLSRADRSRSSKSFVAVSEEQLEVYWLVALSTDGSGTNKQARTCYSEHYAEGVGRSPIPFMRRDLPATAAGFHTIANAGRFSDFTGQGFDDVPFPMNNSFLTAEFPVVLIGDEDGSIWRMNTVTALGASDDMVSYVISATRPLAGGSDIGIVRRVEPIMEAREGSDDLSVSVRTYDRLEGAEEISADEGIAIDQTGSRFTSHRSPGRHARVGFFTYLKNKPWSMSGYRVTTEVLGER